MNINFRLLLDTTPPVRDRYWLIITAFTDYSVTMYTYTLQNETKKLDS